MSSSRDNMIARLRETALATPYQDAGPYEAALANRVELAHDDESAGDRDPRADIYSPARDRMLQRFVDERDRPVETGE